MTETGREPGAGEDLVTGPASTGSVGEEGANERTRHALLAHLRHELCSPLNAILGYAEMLIEDAEAEGQADLLPDLQRIHTAGTQLLARLEEVLEPARFEAASVDLELFGSTLRHELRTPLNAVLGYSEMLLEDARERSQDDLVPDLERIHTAGERFLTLVDDVVRICRVQMVEDNGALKSLAPGAETALVEDAVRAIPSLNEDEGHVSRAIQGSILVVDDSETNRDLLARTLQRQGHSVALAETGQQALEMLAVEAPDLVLLDIMMPGMNGYEVLQRLKSHPSWRNIPVIMISALDEMDSIVRCIELGAEDYLPKPFNPVLLRARTQASLEKKRLRDQELEYLRNVALVTGAAAAVETATFDPEELALEGVAARADELGQLARVFERMAREVHLREQRLKRQLQQLRLDMDEMRKATAEPLSVYIPMDRRQALVHGEALPDRASGAALFADVSGFTPLTAALVQELEWQRGAEELTRTINRVYGALIAEVHRYGGSVIGFSGDAITCWLDGPAREDVGTAAEEAGLRAVACGLAMQKTMARYASVATPTGATFSMGIKVAVVAGPVRRFLVGDPQIQKVEVLAGRKLDELALAEHYARRGEVVAQAEIVERSGGQITVTEWRLDGETGQRFAVVSGLTTAVPARPWPEVPHYDLADEQCRPWLLPAVYERLCGGGRQFLAELRAACALFLNFKGIDYDGDGEAGAKLDAYVRWVQGVLQRYEGALIQLTMGDKGSYLYAALGAPLAHEDDEVRAVCAATALQSPPPELAYVREIRIAVTQGQMRTGAYGSSTRRTYGVIGDKTILAARLMMAAGEDILCDEAIYQASHTYLAFEPLPPMTVKGQMEPVPVFRVLPSSPEAIIHGQMDRLSTSEQLALKVASVIGRSFAREVLAAVLPGDSSKSHLDEHLQALDRLGLIVRESSSPAYRFRDATIHQVVYHSMLFAQRRHLHRQVAEWYEGTFGEDLAPYYTVLAQHWRLADEPDRTLDYLEKASQQARQEGAYEEAERFLQEGLGLEAGSAVLSAGFYDQAPSDYEGAKQYALARLEAELDPRLTYHNLWHTRDEVLPAARRLAKATSIDEDDLRLLEIGAVCHDLGFTVRYQDHERAGADIAAEVLPGFGFTAAQVATVQGMIMATQLPQSPQTLLEQILADADLDVLGREDFSARNEALQAEMAALGIALDEEDWYTRQLAFLESHEYFTAAARALRGEEKRKNIERTKRLLARVSASDAEPH